MSDIDFKQFVNAELPKRININNIPSTGNLLPGKLLKTTGIGLAVEPVDDTPLNQTYIAVHNAGADAIPKYSLVEVSGVHHASLAIPSVKKIDGQKPDIPIGIIVGQLTDDLSKLDPDSVSLFGGKVGLAIQRGRLETNLNTTNSSIGALVYMTTSGNLTLTETVSVVGQVLTLGVKGIIYVNLSGSGMVDTTVNGGIWVNQITPVNPEKNVTVTEWEDDQIKSVIKKATTDTFNINVKVMALSGNTNHKPVIKINGVPVPNVTKGSYPFEWYGEMAITWEASNPFIVVEHEDKAKHMCLLTYESGPVIESVIIENGYPKYTFNGTQFTQSEVKDGDLVSVKVKLANGSPDAYTIRIGNTSDPANAADTMEFDLSANPLKPGVERIFNNIKIGNRGTETQNLGIKVRGKTQRNSWGNWINSYNGTSGIDGIDFLKCNNTLPFLTPITIQYPTFDVTPGNQITQTALKQNETATWQIRGENKGLDPKVLFTSLTNALVLSGSHTTFPDRYEQMFRLDAAGVYNINTTNVRLELWRSENGAKVIQSSIIALADQVPTITVKEQLSSNNQDIARLRNDFTSDGLQHVVVITASQSLFEAPSIEFDDIAAVKPLWAGDWTSNTDKTIWRRHFRIKLETSKGTYTWSNLKATNRALKVVTTITNDNGYIIGGFVRKTLIVPAWNGQVEPIDIGVTVRDTTKLKCSNLSKGASGSENFIYHSYPNNTDVRALILQPSFQPLPNKYTLTNSVGMVVSNPTHWFNLDIQNASSNTTGELRIELEEIV